MELTLHKCKVLIPGLSQDEANIADVVQIDGLDPLIHYHLVRFCGLTRPGYICRSWPDRTLAWHRTTLQLPHHKGGFGLKPVCASGVAAFHSATAHSARWFSGLSNPNVWIADDLARPDDWMCSSLCALRDIHQQLLRDYHCVLADPPTQGPSAPVANAPAAPDGAASPFQLPPLNSLSQPASSGPADSDAASSSRLLPQKRVTQQIMPL